MSNEKSCQKIRVVQWASGSMGKSCMRAVIDRPDLELVGLFVYGDKKVGRDAGDIAHRPETGVLATSNRQEILDLDADVVIHSARIGENHEVHDDDLTALLASGKNVISINGNSFPPHWSEERRAKFDAACKAGNSSFLGAGLNPGFAAEKLLIAATGMCIELDKVVLSEVVHTSVIPSPEYVFERLAFGQEIGAFDMNSDDWGPAMTLNGLFEDVIAAVGERLNWNVERIVRDHRMLPAKDDLQVAAGVIKKGTASHIDWRWRGVVDGEEKIHLNIAWAMDDQYLGDTKNGLWNIRLEGVPTVSIDVDMEKPAGRQGRTSAEQYGVAGSVVNAIANLVKHPPGLATPDLTAHYRQPTA